VARYLFKLMVYKDEYEVARLYSDEAFVHQVRETFDGENLSLHVHLSPPLLSPIDKAGRPRKIAFGPWMFGVFRFLARLKGLRGTALDIFGYTAERRHERALIDEYFATVNELLAKLDHENLSLAVEIASLPEQIRGYGHVKDKHLAKAQPRREQLLDAWRNPRVEQAAA